MLREPSKFFAEEAECTLLNLNKGYLQAHHVEFKQRADGWLRNMGITVPIGYPEPVKRKPFSRSRMMRKRPILIKDAERMFLAEHNKDLFIQTTDVMWTKLADYQQTEGYIAGMLLLAHDIDLVVKALTVLSVDPKYLPGYFKHEATALNIDAWVWFELVGHKFPKVHDHLLKVGVQPDMYCQKYFGGLCIHLLPFKHLVKFLDGFFHHGFRYSFTFALSLIKILGESLLQRDDHTSIMALLRLDAKMAPPILAKLGKALDDSFFEEILAGVSSFENFVNEFHYQELREKIFKQQFQQRMIRATQIDMAGVLEDDDEVVFSDETDSDADSKKVE